LAGILIGELKTTTAIPFLDIDYIFAYKALLSGYLIFVVMFFSCS
jgi:hypothetical protein